MGSLPPRTSEGPPRLYQDRAHAGRELARLLSRHADEPSLCVLGLPRGGVPVAFEVARALRAPLDVLTVRKLGVPGHEEVAFGAIAAGAYVLDRALIEALQIETWEIEAIRLREQKELERRERVYRGALPPHPLQDCDVILVDDGLATGSSLRAALAALRQHAPRRVTVAVPVGAADACAELRAEADEVVCAHSPELFGSVGSWYEDFSQTSDAEVTELLARAAREQKAQRWED